MLPQWLISGIPAMFIIISLGIAIGRIKIAGISLDLSGVLFAGLILGHFGFSLDHEFLVFGLVLFVFSIGMQAGPGFFDAFRQNGKQYILLAVIIISFTAGFALLFKNILHLDPGLNVGIFTGSLTSSPGLAAAIDASKSPMVSIAYGVAYPIGLIGVILAVNIIPKILKINFKKEEEKYFKEIQSSFPAIHGQTFQISNPNLHNKTIEEINIREITNCTASRVMHEGKAFTPDNETTLHTGDYIRLVGSDDDLKKAELIFGKPVEKEIPLSSEYDIQWAVVTNKKIINKHYSDVNLSGRCGAGIVKIKRSGVELKPTPNTVFKFGDKVLIAGPKDAVKRSVSLIGNNEKILKETDILPVFLGIFLGILIGKISIPLFGITTFKLGSTGGVLLAGLLLSKMHKTGPVIWTISASANQLIRKIGLVLFLAVVGSSAGEHIVEVITNQGITLVWYSLLITFIPIIAGIIIGRYIMKINFLTLLGLITGIMTSTPGLGAVQSKSDTNAAPVAYATVYPMAMVLVIIFSQLLVKL